MKLRVRKFGAHHEITFFLNTTGTYANLGFIRVRSEELIEVLCRLHVEEVEVDMPSEEAGC